MVANNGFILASYCSVAVRTLIYRTSFTRYITRANFEPLNDDKDAGNKFEETPQCVVTADREVRSLSI